MKGPAPDRPADGRQRFRADRRHETVRVDIPVPYRLPRSKHETEKAERLVWEVAAPVRILTVDDSRLLRMQQQLAVRKAVGKRTP